LVGKRFLIGWLVRICLALAFGWAAPAFAATCSQAATQGTAPASWQTYCWLDFSTYNDTQARSGAGQNFSYTLTDGSVLTFNLKTTSAAAPAVNAIVAPSWTGAAVGNTAFLGIPGKPILYTAAAGTITVTISSILITPPPGAPAVTAYAFVAADAESTNQGESLQFVTNGSVWTILDQVDPISGTAYPTISGTNTNTFIETGATGTVGGYIVGSNSPTTVTTTMVAGGLQGAMFAVRFASIRLNKTIVGTRLDPADQFTFKLTATSSGTTLATGTTTGAGNGPFTAAAVSLASGLPVTLSETMAAGSVSPLSQYYSVLNCTNGATGSSTIIPTNAVTTSYNLGAVAFGDALQCNFTNTPFARLRIAKALGGARVFTADQFVMNIKAGATTVATTTTTGSGATITTGQTPLTVVTAGTAHSFSEAPSGTTNLTYYTSGIACTNSFTGSTTPLPTALPANVTPTYGDNITCTITNTPKPATAVLKVVKGSTIVSDPVNGTTNPKAIPGAVVRYSINVVNTATGPVDSSTIIMLDSLPAGITFYAAGTPVQFINGTPVSGLTFAYASNVTYRNAANTVITLNPDINGYDAAVKSIRVAPGGVMAGATAAGQPSFTIEFLARIN
jgi:hypothetical protein